MAVFCTNPLNDARWLALLERHPDASIFHTREWLEALYHTYRYEPVAYTTSRPASDLENAIVFCKVDSWLTGKRLVSLPFSDHCQPLMDSSGALYEILERLQSDQSKQGWKYIELRPLSMGEDWMLENSSLSESDAYFFHRLNLKPTINELMQHFHKDCIQRPIRRAQREGLTFKEGSSDELLSAFYAMLLMTRRKHQLPPQPKQWFRNLRERLGKRIKIRIAFNNDQPIAAIVTLSYKNKHYYKYGGSDPRYKSLGGTVALLWRAMLEAKENGAQEFDMGRSDIDNPGLTTFKDRWGSERRKICYLRSTDTWAHGGTEGWKMRFAKQVFSHLPDPILALAGNLLYKHIG
jgi:hypothetical protein